MRHSARILVLAVLALGACAPFRYYPLPVSPGEARATFAPIATAASNLGYHYWQHPDQVTVEPDAKTRLAFMFDASGNYVMCVTFQSKDNIGDVETALAQGKAQGDDLWNRAMELRRATAPAPVQYIEVPAPPPGIQINIGR